MKYIDLYKNSSKDIFKVSSILLLMLLTACSSENSLLVDENPPAAPIANDDTISLTQDTSFTSEVNLVSNDTDVNGDTLTVFSGSFGTRESGSIIIDSDGSYIYTPATGFIGTDTYMYTLSDGTFTDTATLTVIVTTPPIANNAPIAANENISLLLNSTFTSSTPLLFNDSDENGDSLSIESGTYSTDQNGSITIDTEGNYVYTPAAGFSGTDTFSYLVSDGILSTTAILTIAVIGLPENNTPVANIDQIILMQNTTFTSSISLLANDIDLDGDNLTVAAGTFTSSQNGSITIALDGSYSYTPMNGFIGSDSISYSISDGISSNSSFLIATIIEIPATNVAPLATTDAIVTEEGSTFTSNISLLNNDLDVNGDTLTAVAGTFSTTQNGSININTDGSYIYTPATNFSGADTFTYTVSDGDLSDSAELLITVSALPINNPPIANDDALSTTVNNAFTSTISLIANDIDQDNDPLTVVAGSYTSAQSGTLTLIDDGSYTYTPAAGFIGSDAITYTLTDGDLTDTATLYITVLSNNNPPHAVDDNATSVRDTVFNSIVDLDYNDSDPEGDLLSTIAGTFSTTQNGSLLLRTDGSYIYTPASGFIGLDAVNYALSDGLSTDTATLFITVAEVNNRPDAKDDNAVAITDTPLTSVISLMNNDQDADANPLTTFPGTYTTTQSGALALLEDGNYIYTPAPGFAGTDAVNYTISDGGLTDTATLFIIVTASNAAPDATDDYTSVIVNSEFDSSVNLNTNDNDPNSHTLTVISGTFATTQGGVLTIQADGSYHYTPAAGFNGLDAVNYTLTDGALTDTATLFLTVSATNNPPNAVDDSTSTVTNETLTSTTDLDDNDSDPDGNIISVVPGTFSTTQGGSLFVQASGSYIYSPASGFNGQDAVNYTITDGALTDTATLFISVSGSNNKPVANDDNINAIMNTLYTSIVTLTANDTDVEGSNLSVTSGSYTSTQNGTLNVQSNGSYTYTPATDFVGLDAVNYTISDGDLSDTATLFITVTTSGSSCGRHISVDGNGDGLSISAPGNMSDLDQFMLDLAAGGELCIHSGTYGTNYVIRTGGTESNPVTIRGILTGSRLPLFKGIFQAGPDVMGGEDTFELQAGNLVIKDMEFENVGQAFRLPHAVANVRLESFKAVNVEAAVHIESSEHIENITISKAMILQFSRGGIYIGGSDTTNIQIIDSYIDMQPDQIGGRGIDFAVGIGIHDVSNVEIRNTTVLNVTGRFTDYTQGDGLDASPDVDDLRVINSYFRGNQDGCVDTKAGNTVIEDTIAIGCKINYRLWQDNAPNGPYCNRCISYQPVGDSHFGVYGNDGTSDIIEVYSDNNALIYLPVDDGTVRFQVNTATGTIASSAGLHPNLSITDNQLSYGQSFIIPPIPNPTSFTP